MARRKIANSPLAQDGAEGIGSVPSEDDAMTRLTRRGFLVATACAGAVRGVLPLAGRVGARRVLTLVRDKASGGLRAVDRVVR
jgi:hypothetical protein